MNGLHRMQYEQLSVWRGGELRKQTFQVLLGRGGACTSHCYGYPLYVGVVGA